MCYRIHTIVENLREIDSSEIQGRVNVMEVEWRSLVYRKIFAQTKVYARQGKCQIEFIVCFDALKWTMDECAGDLWVTLVNIQL